MRILVTGGAGFIGSAVVHHLIDHTDHHVINLDKLTYAGNPQGFAGLIRFVTDRPATTSATP